MVRERVTAGVRVCVCVKDGVCEAVGVSELVAEAEGVRVREGESGSRSHEAATLGDAVTCAERDSEGVSEGVPAGVPVRDGVRVRAADQEAGGEGAGGGALRECELAPPAPVFSPSDTPRTRNATSRTARACAAIYSASCSLTGDGAADAAAVADGEASGLAAAAD